MAAEGLRHPVVRVAPPRGGALPVGGLIGRAGGADGEAATLVALMERVTGEAPRLWATVVGFGQYHYQYASGREGDAPAAGFASRKSASTVYVPDGVGAHRDLLERLGPHSTGVGCIYIKDLQEVDLDVLAAIVTRSYTTLTSGTYRHRARDSG